MTICTNGCCTDPEMADMKHGLPRRERLRNDPDYGDYLYEQERDRRMGEEADKEERPPADHAILKALFGTLPVVFAKEEKGRWSGVTEKSLKRSDDHE